jgi:hypothetical protein
MPGARARAVKHKWGWAVAGAFNLSARRRGRTSGLHMSVYKPVDCLLLSPTDSHGTPVIYWMSSRNERQGRTSCVTCMMPSTIFCSTFQECSMWPAYCCGKSTIMMPAASACLKR